MEEELINQENSTVQTRGITGTPLMYMRLPTGEQDTIQASQEINEALNAAFDNESPESIGSQLAADLGLQKDSKTAFNFINYGNDQLVYAAIMSDPERSETVTALVNQPRRPFGETGIEFQNLHRLSTIDPQHVLKPLAYFQDGKQEVMVTPYVNSARCIYGGYGEWGVFDPEPTYHFRPFNPQNEEKVAENMIALLVHLYDKENGTGIANTHLSGDDFIISQDWDLENTETMLENMKLIAARKLVKIPFEEYLDCIRKEFTIGTHYRTEDEATRLFTINKKSEISISSETIEKGIELGSRL